MKKNVLLLSFVFILILAVSGFATTFQGLGFISEGQFNRSLAQGVSADGKVVVGYSNSAKCWEDDAFYWSASHGMTNMDVMGNSWMPNSTALDVSANGTVIVGSSSSAASGNQAFRWSASGGWLDLGSGHYYQSDAMGVSADGSVVVGYGGNGYSADAFRWTASDGIVSLGGLPGGSIYNIAWDVSADGSVIVGSADSQAYRWTVQTGMVALGGLPGGGNGGEALGVSADGSVVVGYANSTSGYQAFRWTAASGMVALGGECAEAVSADGSIIVGEGSDGAFYWTAPGGMQSVQQMLTSRGVDLTGWSLSGATGISSDGMTIAGYGTDPQGRTQAWVATIPEPATVLLLTLGCLILRKK